MTVEEHLNHTGMETVIKYDIVVFYTNYVLENIDGRDTLIRLGGGRFKTIKSCDTIEEAERELNKCVPSTEKDGRYYYTSEYSIVKHEYEKE